MSFSTSKTPAITPRKTMRGHTDWVQGVVHLHGGQHIITCSLDGSLRLWDIESGAQIGEDWQDGNNGGVWSIALSPNGETVASGSSDGTVKLWNVETRKVIAKWAEHTHLVGALCWSADGNQVLSGSWDGAARIRDVKNGETVLTVKTGHRWMCAVIYSPDATKIATGGRDENAVKIWNAKTGKLFKTLIHDTPVYGLAWTSDGKKLISGAYLFRIFNTTTWEEIAILKGHESLVHAISLSQNECLLASASWDRTARLWNLDTNLPIGPPLQHESVVNCTALSPDGKVLVTGCENEKVYTWDIHAILKEAGFEDLLQPLSNVPAQKPLMNSNAARRPLIQARRIPPAFFDGMQNDAQSSAARNTQAPFLERFSSLFHHSQQNTYDATELQQRPKWSIFSRGPRIVEVPLVKDREVIFTAPPPPQKTQQQTQSHAQSSSTISPAPVLIPSHHVQDMCIHFPSVCWLISCFFSAAHLLNTPMPMHNQHTNNKANRKAKSRPSHYRRRLCLLPSRHPRHFLLSILVLLRQVQQACSHDRFYCGLISFSYSVVHPLDMQMGIHTAVYGQSSHLCI